jgi:hypothetical protein
LFEERCLKALQQRVLLAAGQAAGAAGGLEHSGK